jgi:hypothetical protein
MDGFGIDLLFWGAILGAFYWVGEFFVENLWALFLL